MRYAFKMPFVLFVLTLTMVFADSTLARGRYLHPGLGRFINRDPNGMDNIGTSRPLKGFLARNPTGPQKQYADGMNLYQYLKSSPTMYTDWNGLECFTVLRRGTPSGRGPARMMIDGPGGEPYYIDKECCCKLTVIVEYENYWGAPSSPGHAGVGVDGKFYDLGGAGGEKKNVPATPWWMAFYPDVSKVIAGLPNVSSGQLVVAFEMFVEKEKCDRINNYWTGLLSNPGQYHFLANSCVTSTTNSLQAGGILPNGPGVITASDLAGWVDRIGNHTCGPRKGEAADIKYFDFR